jgi:alditol oxidase
MAGLTNWAGNHAFTAARLHEPQSLEQLQEIARQARFVRVVGSRHSFNDIADTTGDLVSLDRMPRRFELDQVRATVTVDGGVTYGAICAPLDAAGYALNNLASLPHISVAGSCATATHGSGDQIGNLSTAVSAMEIVTAEGEISVFARDRDPDMFQGAVVSLGALGIVTSLTLQLQPAFRMRQDLYRDLSLAVVVDRFDEITASADSVSLFTEWRDAAFEQVWLKRRVREGGSFEPPRDFFGATIATSPIHPIRGMSPSACTQQLGIAGPWHERLPHFRIDHTPSSGAELQSEYLVPRRHAVGALLAIHGVRDRFASQLQVSEVRTIAADALWVSTAFGRDSVAFHFTWLPDWEGVRRVLPSLEAALAPFEPRPHWGKLFRMSPAAVKSTYEKLPAFAALIERVDPTGKFRNAFVDRYILVDET